MGRFRQKTGNGTGKVIPSVCARQPPSVALIGVSDSGKSSRQVLPHPGPPGDPLQGHRLSPVYGLGSLMTWHLEFCP